MGMIDRTTLVNSAPYSVVDLLGPAIAQKILFVSSQRIINRSFKRTMGKQDFDITLVESSAQAIKELETTEYALILTTDEVDEISGTTLLEMAKNKSPDTNRILISGKTDLDATVQAINEIGLFKFVVLPWEPTELRESVRRACDHYSLKHENVKLGDLLNNKADELAQLAGKLENEVQNRTTSLLIGLNAALDLRDTETQSHSRRVALYARRLAQEIDLSSEELTTIERGSLLHDIGKIGVSDTILLKPGKLTDEEWTEMRKHAEHGYRILEGITFLGDARLLVWQHHERYDGSGYPQGLKGDEIYIGARIFAIIDTYDAMTSDRPYRKGLPHDVAIGEINSCSGVQFDPHIVDAWNRIPLDDILELKQVAEKNIHAGAI